jgi:hypothetical protein
VRALGLPTRGSGVEVVGVAEIVVGLVDVGGGVRRPTLRARRRPVVGAGLGKSAVVVVVADPPVLGVRPLVEVQRDRAAVRVDEDELVGSGPGDLDPPDELRRGDVRRAQQCRVVDPELGA